MQTISEFCWSLRGMSLEAYTADEVIRIKWAAEALADKARRELQTRDARVVDAVCRLSSVA